MTDSDSGNRTASITRETKETNIKATLDLDGNGSYEVSTGIGMLDHMLEQIARHGMFDLTVDASGDIDRDAHHLVEDVGIVLGTMFSNALGERRGIARMGHAIVPLDEALALVAIDLSGRGHASVDVSFDREEIGGLPMENLSHFLSSFASEGKLTLHVRLLAGANDHHRAEAVFKALAKALMMATRTSPSFGSDVPSTKGTL